MVWGLILLLRLKNKNKVFKKSVNYFLTFMKNAKKVYLKKMLKQRVKFDFFFFPLVPKVSGFFEIFRIA